MLMKLFYWKFLPLCTPRSFVLLACVLGFLVLTLNILNTRLEQEPIDDDSTPIDNPLDNERGKRYRSVSRSRYYPEVEAKRRITLMLNSLHLARKNSNSLLGEEFDYDEYISNNTTNINDPMSQHHFNVVISDKIGYDRVLWDVRNPMCKRRDNGELLAEGVVTVSIIICFHNEARSALLRTIYSVLDKTPSGLLAEILLIDDFSNNIEDGLLLQLIPKVRVIRLSNRQGLVRARVVGAKQARGSLLAFLDSHCEVTVGWLEPLVTRVTMFRNHIVSPVIDIINKNNMKYITANVNIKGGFGHNLYFKWLKLNGMEMEERRRDVTSAIVTPAIAGGLFVVDKKFFMEIGSYDEEMEIWGGENVELSIRVWMCGGRLEITPCSHVGHIFRSTMPYGFGEGRNYFNTVLKNLRRTAEVWMGSDKDIFYSEIPEAKNVDYGNLTARLNLKNKLKCNSFQWFINNIFPEFRSNYKVIIYYQFVQWRIGCITVDHDHRNALIRNCEMPAIGPSSNQVWEYSSDGQIKHNNECLTAVKHVSEGATISIEHCVSNTDQQSFTMVTGKQENVVKLQHNSTGLCIAARRDSNRFNLYFEHCNSNSLYQGWIINKIT